MSFAEVFYSDVSVVICCCFLISLIFRVTLFVTPAATAIADAEADSEKSGDVLATIELLCCNYFSFYLFKSFILVYVAM